MADVSALSVPRQAAVVLGVTVAGALALALTDSLGPVTVTAWPIGVVTGVALMFRERGGSLVLVLATLALFGTFVLAGEPAWLAALVASAQTLGAAMAIVTLTGGARHRAFLRSEDDVVRYLEAALLGAALCGVYLGTCLATLGQDAPWATGVSAAVAHLASQLLYLPFFLPTHPHHRDAGRVEMLAQWACILVLTVAPVSVPTSGPVLFAVVAVLAWGARRLSTPEILGQTVFVTTLLGVAAVHGVGPLRTANSFLPWTPHPVPLLVALFTCCCVVVVVPTVLNVGLQRVLLREASERRDWFERIVDSPRAIAIYGTDADGLITMFNPGAQRLLGYSAAEVMGRSPRMFHRDQDIATVAEQMGVPDDFLAVIRGLSNEDETSRTVLFCRKDGVLRTHLTTLNRITDLDGEITGYVAISEDVTDRVREQEALEEALEGLRQLDASKDAFVSSVSHELRTPLTSMMGYLELVRDGAFGAIDDPQRDALARVESNARRLLDLIEDLLTFARLGERPAAWAEQDLDLATVVRTGCEVVRPAWETRSVIVRLSLPATAVSVRGDATVLERMVVNLVGNAVKFTPSGGSVEVSLHAGDDALLEVRDSGIGIPADELPRLFERFFRSRLAVQGAVRGSGIGLSIVKAAVDVHGGTIEVDSQEGVGTTMRIRLPLAATSGR